MFPVLSMPSAPSRRVDILMVDDSPTDVLVTREAMGQAKLDIPVIILTSSRADVDVIKAYSSRSSPAPSTSSGSAW